MSDRHPEISRTAQSPLRRASQMTLPKPRRRCCARRGSAAALIVSSLVLHVLTTCSAVRHDVPDRGRRRAGDVDGLLEEGARMRRRLMQDLRSPDEEPRCYDQVDSLSREVPGEVVRGPTLREPSGTPPYEMGRFPYSNQFCREQASRHLYFQTDGCSLDDLDPVAFLEAIRGRRLVLWGDSVQRQFFLYLAVRLRAHEEHRAKVFKDTHYPKLGGHCGLHALPDAHTGMRIHPSCFEHSGDWWGKCFTYHGAAGTSLCFVRAERDVVDDANAGLFNDLRPQDIVLANVGIHCNKRESMAAAIREFAAVIRYQASHGRRLPTILWRDTSPQHFRGSPGGNYPVKEHVALRNVDPIRYRCSAYTHDEMRSGDFRNHALNAELFESFRAHGLHMPVLRVWNASSLLPGKHPQVLGHSSVADCTHWCPNLGGIYEVWSHLLYNLLTASLRHEDTLRPTPNPNATWQYPLRSTDQHHHLASDEM